MSALQISGILGVAPSRSYEKGDLVSARSARPGYRKVAMWLRHSGLGRQYSWNDHLLAIAGFLDEKKEKLLSLRDCRMDVSCGVFSDNQQIFFTIDHRVIKALSDYPVDIIIDAYPKSDEKHC